MFQNSLKNIDTSWHPLIDGNPPKWASGWGLDDYGVWVEIAIGEVIQKMRWIPAGVFEIGSLNDNSNELPLHQVIHEQGYWLFDTPVTQALWHEVMGENLSQFKSLKRPVENLSWEDCQKFLININEQIPGINLCLPTESQWEYACRAATETALYNGDIEIIGDANAPALNNIAWYGGNSGVGFELENNYNITHLKNRQYKDNPSGTHPVALKLPNNWGLYDMLGNVSEWTSDSLHNSEEDRRVNSGKVLRVIRGGSYNDSALVCNSAARYWYPQDFHFNFIGFRCARKDKGN